MHKEAHKDYTFDIKLGYGEPNQVSGRLVIDHSGILVFEFRLSQIAMPLENKMIGNGTRLMGCAACSKCHYH